MKIHTLVQGIVIGAMGIMLSGCGALIDWYKETVPQSATHAYDKKTVQQYLKSIRLYDEFATIAMFDVLWLSDEIRTMYAKQYSAVRKHSSNAETEAIRRQLQVNETLIAFYVLSLRSSPLHTATAQWIAYLDVDGVVYYPQEIKFIELVPHFKAMFGSLLTKHKQACEVKFNRIDQEGRDIMLGKKMTLHFSDHKYYGSIEWDLTKKSVVIKKNEK